MCVPQGVGLPPARVGCTKHARTGDMPAGGAARLQGIPVGASSWAGVGSLHGMRGLLPRLGQCMWGGAGSGGLARGRKRTLVQPGVDVHLPEAWAGDGR